MLTNNVAVYHTTSEMKETAKMLADKLQLPLLENSKQHPYAYLLIVTPHHIGLQKSGSKQTIYIDFMNKSLKYRRERLSLKKEAIARALGLKKNTYPTIVDATGGLVRDSFILASLGFQVTLLERSPIISELIYDGITRGKQYHDLSSILGRITFIQTDASLWLTSLKNQEKPHIIYLDPMFPERKKSALPKKEMLIFQDIVGDDADADRLLSHALTCATQRVVVKRPRLSSSLKAIRSPSFTLTGSSCRFDIYLI